MSESKEMAHESSSASDEQRLRDLPAVDVTAVEISPNPAPLTAELNLEVDFTLDKPVVDGIWDIELGQVDTTDYAKGDNHFQFSATDINVTGIEPSQLTNCGLLIAAFRSSRDGAIMDLKMVVQVTEQRGALQRIIYNPLE